MATKDIIAELKKIGEHGLAMKLSKTVLGKRGKGPRRGDPGFVSDEELERREKDQEAEDYKSRHGERRRKSMTERMHLRREAEKREKSEPKHTERCEKGTHWDEDEGKCLPFFSHADFLTVLGKRKKDLGGRKWKDLSEEEQLQYQKDYDEKIAQSRKHKKRAGQASFLPLVKDLKTAGLKVLAEELEETMEEGQDEGQDENLQTRRELKKKAIDLAASIRDAMAGQLKDKLSPDMVEGATLDVNAVMEMVTGELDRIEDKLAKGIWDAMESATSDWAEKEETEEGQDGEQHRLRKGQGGEEGQEKFD